MIVSFAAGVTIRERVETTSKKLGDLSDGTHVTVHDIMKVGEGKRARVLVDDGPLKGIEGWISYQTKSGKICLMEASGVEAYTKDLPQEAYDAARAAFRTFDTDDSGALTTVELKEVLTRKGGGKALSDAEVEDILQVFDANGDGVLQFEEFAVMFAPGFADTSQQKSRADARRMSAPEPVAAPMHQLTRQLSSWKLKRSSTQRLSDATSDSFANRTKLARSKFSFGGILGLSFGHSANAADKKKTKRAAPRGGSGPTTVLGSGITTPPESERSKLMSTTAWLGVKRTVTQAAEAAATQISELGTSLPVLLANQMLEGGKSPEQLLSKYDTNRNGNFSKQEFRLLIKSKELGLSKDATTALAADSLFESLDEDNDGSLGLEELKRAFRLFQQRHAQTEMRLATFRATEKRCVERIEQIQKAHEATSAYEEADSQLRSLRVMLGHEDPSQKQSGQVQGKLDARLYAVMQKRNMKIADVIRIFDRDGSGTVELDEFCESVKKLVPTAVEAEATALFRELDSAQVDNSLDLKELDRSLRLLERRAKEAMQEEATLTRQVKELKRIASRAQAEVMRVLEVDEQEATAREAKEAAEGQPSQRASKPGRASKGTNSRPRSESPTLQA